MILFQVRDLAAKSCGEPHVAPSWEIAKASLGAMLAKTPELAERAHSLKIELLGDFDPETGFDPMDSPAIQWQAAGDVCLAEFIAACRKEEDQKQEEADSPHFYHKNVVSGELDEVPLTKERSHGDPCVYDTPETREEVFGK